MELQITNYIFDASAKTIVCSDYTSLVVERLQYIRNLTKGKFLYSHLNSLYPATIVGNTITIATSTIGMSDSDDLEIIYNDENTNASQSNQQLLLDNIAMMQTTQENFLDMLFLLKRLVKLSESTGVVDNQTRQKINVENTVAVLPQSYSIQSSRSNYPPTTTDAPTNTSTLYYQPTWSGPVDPRWTNIQNARIAYNTGIRSKLITT